MVSWQGGRLGVLKVTPKKKGRAWLPRPQHAEEAITPVTQGAGVEALGPRFAFRGEHTRVDLEVEREKEAMEPKQCGELTVSLHGNGERRLLGNLLRR